MLNSYVLALLLGTLTVVVAGCTGEIPRDESPSRQLETPTEAANKIQEPANNEAEELTGDALKDQELTLGVKKVEELNVSVVKMEEPPLGSNDNQAHALSAGEWAIDKTITWVWSKRVIDCLAADIEFVQARAETIGPLRIEADVTFTCSGPTVLAPVSWPKLDPKNVYIEDAVGNRSSVTKIGGVFNRSIIKPDVGSNWAGWLEFRRPLVSEGTLYLYTKKSRPPIQFTVFPHPLPATSTPIRPPAPTHIPPCPPGEPCVSLYSTAGPQGVPLGQPVLLKLTILNSIAKPQMTAHLYLDIPSGWQLTGSGFTQACPSGCNAVYEVAPGGIKSVEISLLPLEVGVFFIQGRLEWLFPDTPVDGKNLLLRLEVTN